MNLTLEPSEGTVMEKAVAIYNHFKSVDDVQELIDYLQIAVDADRRKEDGDYIPPRRPNYVRRY